VPDALREQRHRLEQLFDAVHRELAGLERHDHLARRAQRVEREHADVGRAVDQAPVVPVRDRRERGRQALGALLRAVRGELLLERREHDARRCEVEMVAPRLDHLGDAGGRPRADRLDQDLVEVLGELLRVDAEGERRVRLGIEVDEQHAIARRGQAAGEVHRGGRLPAAAFLIHDREGAHGRASCAGRRPGAHT
jgi:hypothetical protein